MGISDTICTKAPLAFRTAEVVRLILISHAARKRLSQRHSKDRFFQACDGRFCGRAMMCKMVLVLLSVHDVAFLCVSGGAAYDQLTGSTVQWRLALAMHDRP